MPAIRVKPASPGLVVCNTARAFRPFAADGEDVPDSPEVRNLIYQGDLVLVEPDPAASDPPLATAAANAAAAAVPRRRAAPESNA